MENSFALPTYWRILTDPNIKTIFITGCGGGFDFVHSMTLYPELKRLGKKIIIGSYSFGSPNSIEGGKIVFSRKDTADIPSGSGHVNVKLVDATCIPARHYGPEVGMCQFLDGEYPNEQPHTVYAYYARAFTVTMLTDLYTQICTEHAVDCICVIDGGSDSLMRGNESGLGDPIEDATSICAAFHVANALGKERIKASILVSIGFGCDRFNGISDAASMRAVSELSASGGFLGSMAVEKTSPLMQFYDKCVKHLQANASFRSVIANSIIESSNGAFGDQVVPDSLKHRVSKGELFLWPLMAMHFAFSVEHLYHRSAICPLLDKCVTVSAAYDALNQMRKKMQIKKWENIPNFGPAYAEDDEADIDLK